jgi:hypothetical protein
MYRYYQFWRSTLNDNKRCSHFTHVTYRTCHHKCIQNGNRNYRVRTFLQESCWATFAHFSASVTTCINACNNSDSGNFFCSASCNNDLTSVRSEKQRQSYHWLLQDHMFHNKFSTIFRNKLFTIKPKPYDIVMCCLKARTSERIS